MLLTMKHLRANADWPELRGNAGKDFISPCWTPRHGTETIKVPVKGDPQPQEREVHAKDLWCLWVETQRITWTLSALIAVSSKCVDETYVHIWVHVCEDARTKSNSCILQNNVSAWHQRSTRKSSRVKLAISWSVCMCVLMCLSLLPVSSSELVVGLSLAGRHRNIHFISSAVWQLQMETSGYLETTSCKRWLSHCVIYLLVNIKILSKLMFCGLQNAVCGEMF